MANNPQVIEAEPFEPALTHGYPDLIHIAWRRKWLIALGIALGLGVGYAYYGNSTPVYKSAAQVLVIKKRATALPNTAVDPNQVYYDDYSSAQQALIQSPLIVDRAIQRGKLRELESLRGRNPRDVITGGISVAHDNKNAADRSNVILDLTYKSTVAADCGIVLNAVIDSYQDFLDEVHRKDGDKVLKLFTQWKNEVQSQLVQKQDAYKKLRATTPLTSKGQDELKLSEARLARFESEKLGCIVRQAEIRQQLAAIEAAKKSGLSHDALLELISKWSSRTSGGSAFAATTPAAQDQLLQLLLQEQTLLKDLGPEHAEIVALRKRIDLARDWVARQSAEGESASKSRIDAVDAYTQYLEQDMHVNAGVAESLTKLLDLEHAKAKKTNDQIEDIEELRNDIASIQELYKGITKHLEDLSLTKDSGGYDAQVISPPGSGSKIAPNRLLIMSLAFLAGILAGAGLACLAEIADRSFRTPKQIRSRLGAPVIGHIPFLRLGRKTSASPGPAGATLEPILCTYYWPESMEAEAYRAVRTALYFSAGRAGHKVIQITSPALGDGKTALAANLAVSLAQSGKRIALIDADLRRPRLHQVFGLSAQSGLTSIIASQQEPDKVIQPTRIPGLWVLPSGPIPPNPADLLVSARFKELLDYLRDRYDWVLLDTSALLTVTDPSVVAGRVDGVLLTMRISKDNRLRADRAKEILDTLATPVFGIVVNAVETQSGSGGYYYECSHDRGGYLSWLVGRSTSVSSGPDRSSPGLAESPPASQAASRNGHADGRTVLGEDRAADSAAPVRSF